MTTRDKFDGCFFGSIVGDALGMPYEFKDASEIQYEPVMKAGGPFNLPKGCWTDDTSMMLCLANSLISKQGFDAQDQLLKYYRWYSEGYNSAIKRCFDIGNQTELALNRFNCDINQTTAKFETHRAGNGALMRINPIPLVYSTVEEILNYSELSTITTHNNDRCVEASFIYTGIINLALNGIDKHVIQNSFPVTLTNYDVDGYVYGSMTAALDAFYKTNSFEECMEFVIKLGGDTDTNACIAGMLAGAYYGFNSIPQEWVNDLINLQSLKNTCEQLYQLRLSLCQE